MKTATVRDLRYHFSETEPRLEQGEEFQIRKRRCVIARLVPVRPKAAAYPDFAVRRKKIFGGRAMKVTSAKRLAEERDRYLKRLRRHQLSNLALHRRRQFGGRRLPGSTPSPDFSFGR